MRPLLRLLLVVTIVFGLCTPLSAQDYSFEIPELKSSDDKISIYLWNIEHQHFLIDDFQLKFYRLY